MSALFAQLTPFAPSIVLETHWEPDPDATWNRQPSDVAYPGNALDGEDPDDWTCWQSEIRATAIVDGKFVTGRAYLGDTWEKAGADPRQSNPEISGYAHQMTCEALEELLPQLPPGCLTAIHASNALSWLTHN